MSNSQTHNSPESSPAPPPEHEEFLFIDSPPLISAAPPSAPPLPNPDSGSDSDSEFSFSPGAHRALPPIPADEIFSGGRIRPVYPVFDRALLLDDGARRQPLLRLLIEDRGAPAASGIDDLAGVPPASYCVWRPGEAQPPGVVRKSSSTGSSRRRRIRDFVVGRSQSDGKEKFMFFAAAEEKGSAAKGGKGKGKEKKKATELDLVSAHRMFYGKGGDGVAAGGRKSYLPYKPEIVGFFARVNGIGRAHHPF